MKSYDELFTQRGTTYDRAMRDFPHARDEEFLQAIQRAELKPGQIIADVPAGGGYLRNYLPAECQWLGHEPCASFFANDSTGAPVARQVPLLPLPWQDNSVDALLSIAGVHHVNGKTPLFREFLRVVKPGGRLVLSDVAANSKVSNFLDGYMGDHNSTGHEGVFLDQHTLLELRAAGWTVLSDELVDFHWVFDDRQAMASFCIGLFDMCRATVTGTIEAIENQLGVDRLADGRVGMRWQLMTVVATRSHSD